MNLLMKMPEADVRFMALPASLFAENSCVYTIISLFLFMPEWCSIVCWRDYLLSKILAFAALYWHL